MTFLKINGVVILFILISSIFLRGATDLFLDIIAKLKELLKDE